MTADEYPEKPCAGKTRHRTQAIARRVAHDMQLKYREVILPYYCSDCGGWHTGHPSVKKLKTYLERQRNRRERILSHDRDALV